jgi:hypothetical protein
MAKTCPSCGYRPIGPFTDNCPICAEPVRNVRSDRGGYSGMGGVSPVLKWVGVGLLVGVLLVAGCCGIGMWKLGDAVQDAQRQMELAQAKMEAERKARTVVVSAAELLNEFNTAPTEADKKYDQKYLELTGIVERTGQARHDPIFIIMHAGDDTAKIKIECFFDLADDKEEAELKRFTKGQRIKLRGEYDGHVSNVRLRDCTLVKDVPKE